MIFFTLCISMVEISCSYLGIYKQTINRQYTSIIIRVDNKNDFKKRFLKHIPEKVRIDEKNIPVYSFEAKNVYKNEIVGLYLLRFNIGFSDLLKDGHKITFLYKNGCFDVLISNEQIKQTKPQLFTLKNFISKKDGKFLFKSENDYKGVFLCYKYKFVIFSDKNACSIKIKKNGFICFYGNGEDIKELTAIFFDSDYGFFAETIPVDLLKLFSL